MQLELGSTPTSFITNIERPYGWNPDNEMRDKFAGHFKRVKPSHIICHE